MSRGASASPIKYTSLTPFFCHSPLTGFEFGVQAAVRMPARDQYQRVEFHPALALVHVARQLAAAAIGALGAVAENVVHLQPPLFLCAS